MEIVINMTMREAIDSKAKIRKIISEKRDEEKDRV